MKKINTGNSSFETLITNGNLYVDKTKYLYNLLSDGGTFYFLSRPRRFGKSLTLSTLEAIFKGKRELFKGLYIDSTDYDWKEHPVIRIDFSLFQSEDVGSLKKQLKNILLEVAKKYGLGISTDYEYNEILNFLIVELSKREKVVILIDEYDSILTNNINSDKLEEIRTVLRGFYSILKAQAENIGLCFITGVTKFAKMSIFSAMNNLTDISLNDKYATMLGYTQQELEYYFEEYIVCGAKTRGINREEFLQAIKKWYNGYLFATEGETVYNPVSVGSFFQNDGKVFKNYWISTGGMPYILTEVAKRVQFDVSMDNEFEVSSEALESPDLVQMVKTNVSKDNFLSLLYQTGYLTIHNSELVGESYLVTLGYPNLEVKKGLTEILLPLYMGSRASSFQGIRVLKLFNDGKVEEAMTSLSSVYASIPYHELVFNAENACHAAFLCMMNLLGADVVAEKPTNIGRIDAVLSCPKFVYIIEFKFNQSSEVAIKQIRENKYYEPYLACGKAIHLLGINFSAEQKNIVEWKDEILC